MRRLLICTPLALLIGSGFFILLGKLIGVQAPQHHYSQPVHVTLTALDDKPSLQTRSRAMPPPPPPPTAATMLLLPTLTAGQPQAQTIPIPNGLNVAAPTSHLDTPVTLNTQVGSLDGVQVALGIDAHPVVVSRLAPLYPRRAQQRNIEGEVTAEFIVQPNGQVKPGSIKIVAAKPPNIFDNAVKQAIYGWKFQPKMQQGQAVAYRAQQNIAFSLEN
ncbi:energy transducer TonB [Celerinatantimonas yamalensis]|uniref:Protein TonB n=1 Tax=Celerinatantimonas yamalensis TaxID=559956 RepID=A0ABW9G7M9_9GAMM